MEESAYVSSEILDVMIHGFQDCASSIASLRGAVRGHIDKCMSVARTMIEKLQAIEQQAAERAERCWRAYDSCQARQKYDEEKGEYRPSCSLEEHRMKRAEDAHYKAKEALRLAQMCLNDMEREVGYYEQSQGGEGMMNSITEEYVPEATARLFQLREKVEQYEAFVMTGVDSGDSSSSTSISQTPHVKAEFNKGTERLNKIMEQRKTIFGNYCPKCKCCPCQCGVLELYRQHTR